MSKDLPNAIADNDKQLDELLLQLEKGEVPVPEVAATPENPTPEAKVDTPEDDPKPKAKPDLETELGKAQARYKTLQGMMTADANRSKDIIEELKEQLAANRVAQVEAPLDVSTILTQDEVDTFGEEGVKVLEKLAGAIATKEISKATLEVEQKLEAMRKRVEQAEATTGGNTTWDRVEKINPGALEINKSDQGWFEFLETADPVSGRLYRDLGEAAANVDDLQRLSELIDIYRLSANLAKPAIPVKPAQTATKVPTNDGNRQRASEKRTYSQEEVREFYDHRARGIGKGITANLNAKQLEALEADIDAAMEEGRVTL
jgi:GTPase SAR1 family protein